MRIAFTTLGCKINQYETEHLQQDLQARGNIIVSFEDQADVYVINTCSVTAKSDYQCRQVIKAAVRRGGNARIVVTGCYASTRPGEVAGMPGVELVIPNSEKSTIPLRIMQQTSGTDALLPELPIQKSCSGRTRAFLKIQDGCDNQCSYCIVPLARGSSRSVPPGSVIREFEGLIKDAYPEVVLSGIHIGTYGRELTPRTSLTDLVRVLLQKHGRPRVRLSSIEANEVSEEIISFLGEGLCRHLHIPLQSGDDSILRSMGRRYTASFYRKLIERIAKQIPGIALGTDIIVGFPGEGDEEFLNTLDLVRQTPLSHFHVFTYSPRPGTPASKMKEQVPDSVKKSRSEQLRQVCMQKNNDFRENFIGSTLKVVIEDDQTAKRDTLTGLADNYLRITILSANKGLIGKEINVRIEKIENEQIFATYI